MNAKLAAIKILENAKKALKEKIESLEKADGKNTAQLNEFKGIPQPPAPKAPAKAIAPTPKIPQPKMPGMGKSSEEMNKAKVDEGKTDEEKAHARYARHARVGDTSGKQIGYPSKAPRTKEKGYEIYPQEKGVHSTPSRFVKPYKSERMERQAHERNLAELKAMPKPNLPKSERPLSSFLKKREGKVK